MTTPSGAAAPDNPPFVFRNKLLTRGLYFDFLRLRCGGEQRFFDAIRKIRCTDEHDRPRMFIAFSEWDAVVITPSNELYPRVLNELYGGNEVASAVSGTAGYFAYLWDHPINADLDRRLTEFQSDGVAIMVSLRFEDWFRREVGLGGEMLFCDFLARECEKEGLSAIVAHTLGWNDVVVTIHATSREQRLIRLVATIRTATAQVLSGDVAADAFGSHADSMVFAASYTHLISGYARYLDQSLTFGELVENLDSALLLVRVSPSREGEVRECIAATAASIGDYAITLEQMPSEMGHYSFSVDISALAVKDRGNDAVRLVSSVRNFIGATGEDPPSSYPETSTTLRFRETMAATVRARSGTSADPAIAEVAKVMSNVIPQLQALGASPMSVYRFGAVLTTLLDHLSDPVRSAVVRHMAKFVLETAAIVPTLQRDQLEDFCHICEYAMTQATDGIVQFQHDANTLGLTGRGGYSRLITAIETYVEDLLAALDMPQKSVLITFGLRTGHAGVTGRFQIDVPFNVLFVPSRWSVLLHETGHIAWVATFGWIPESLKVFERQADEIRLTRREKTADEVELAARLDFIRTREIIREFFPNLLVWRIACGGDFAAFDRLSLRHIVSSNGATSGTRELLMAVVLHALLEVVRTKEAGGTVVGREWWKMWGELSDSDQKAAIAGATAGIGAALDEAEHDSNERTRPSVAHKRKLLWSDPFRDAVVEAFSSVVMVLRFSATEFSKGQKEELAERQFKAIQSALAEMMSEQADFTSWPARGFAEWLMSGTVLARAPGAHILCRLLLETYPQMKHAKSPGAFMVSQLSALLALWHRGVTGERDEGKHTTDVLSQLQLATYHF